MSEPPIPLLAELLYRESADVDIAEVVAKLRETLPASRLARDDDGTPIDDLSTMIVHEQFRTVIADGTRVPLFTGVAASEPGERRVTEREHDFSQSWGWPEAQAVVEQATASVLLFEYVGHLHTRHDRSAAFRAVVDAVIATTAPIATWWPNVDLFVPPADLGAHELEGLVNVRVYRVEDEDGGILMDSLGLHAFGLPDMQCHFRGLDPSAVANLLLNTALYVFERGDVIEDGNTISGLRGDGQWPCRHGAAEVAPDRAVLAIEPEVARGSFWKRRRR